MSCSCLAAHTDVEPVFDSMTEKSGTVGVFDKAGSVDTICILLPTQSWERLVLHFLMWDTQKYTIFISLLGDHKD